VTSPSRRKYHVEIGSVYGLWTIVADAGYDKYSHRVVTARCGCGAERIVKIAHVCTGHSLGCRSCSGQRAGSANGTHGATRGAVRTPEFTSWSSMLMRCSNPHFAGWKDYGGRGIQVCDRWMQFENFLADMGQRPPGKSLDRINNDGNYEPSNCKWSTPKEQANNRRKRLAHA
jgi:hypothetical protein